MVNRYTITNISFISKTFKINDEKIQSIYNAYPTKKLPIISLDNKESIDNVIIENVKNCKGNYDKVIFDSIKKLFPNIKFYISKSSCFLEIL